MRDRITEVIISRLKEMTSEWGVELTPEQIDLPNPPDASMGDYAINLPMKLAKHARQAPIKIAERIAGLLSTETEWFSLVTVAPPGYVNLTLAESAIERMLSEAGHDIYASLKREGEPQMVVVDYSGVNISKQMHVGHLRSTIIGDVIARVLEARGENVIRQNHLGDWGLPIAMILWGTRPVLREIKARGGDLFEELPLSRLEDLYRKATTTYKENPEAREEIRRILVDLQAGDKELVDDWHTITRLSMEEVYRIYQILSVTLTEKDERGESFYRDMLADTVAALDDCGILVESEGAKCVFFEQFKARDGSPLPVMVQKSDGGFNYATFDLAAVRHCVDELEADRIIYVTDSRQALHFAQIFAVAEACGWTNPDNRHVQLDHVMFGAVLGEDGKPLKTRSGENVKLTDLLQEAVDRAYAVVNEKNPDLPEDYKQYVARAVGIGAVKYADLSHDRNNDYVFAWDRMLALTGNTAPYLQYAHARICSIFRKGGIAEESIEGPFAIRHPAERALALKLLELPEVAEAVEADLRPHILCNYLYELATVFSSFYDQCPVLTAESEEIRNSRLFLCRIVQSAMSTGLGLLGIEAPREM
ncbi:MAG: arginine--tRNA ligase [Armatimonadota bacterium]|nr:arginine--tRNA ligase [Armatimonadota bacterium]